MPSTYCLFESYDSGMGSERVNIYEYYPKTPKMSHQVIFQRSDIERMNSTNKFFEDFEYDMNITLKEMYQKIREEEQNSFNENRHRKFGVISEIAMEDQIQETTSKEMHCNVCQT